MGAFDLHTHTTWCDGKNTPEEMARAAVEKGLDTLGFSGHSYTFFDESYCMPRSAQGYRREIAALREKYASRLRILCGVEQDYYSLEPTEGYDFVIGSAHYLRLGEDYIPVDETPEILRAAAEKYFAGDIYALTECYFSTVAGVAEKTGADIIGHFDLIAKFNERERLFDEAHPRYRAAWQTAAEALLKAGRPFEINTGAISRGYRSKAYPAIKMIEYIRSRGGRFVRSSDSHSAATLCYGFDDYEWLGGALIEEWE
jgi:histidinol-phosphatase (PHP family)